MQQPPDKEEQITTTRGQSSADRDIQRTYTQGKSQQPRGRSRQSQQPDGKQKQIATTRKQSKADRGNQKTKVRGRSKQTKRKQKTTQIHGNQKTKGRGRSKQPRGRSGKIATTKGQFRADRNNQKSIMAIRDNTDLIKSRPEIISLLCRSPGRTMPASPRSA